MLVFDRSWIYIIIVKVAKSSFYNFSVKTKPWATKCWFLKDSWIYSTIVSSELLKQEGFYVVLGDTTIATAEVGGKLLLNLQKRFVVP